MKHNPEEFPARSTFLVSDEELFCSCVPKQEGTNKECQNVTYDEARQRGKFCHNLIGSRQ